MSGADRLRATSTKLALRCLSPKGSRLSMQQVATEIRAAVLNAAAGRRRRAPRTRGRFAGRRPHGRRATWTPPVEMMVGTPGAVPLPPPPPLDPPDFAGSSGAGPADRGPAGGAVRSRQFRCAQAQTSVEGGARGRQVSEMRLRCGLRVARPLALRTASGTLQIPDRTLSPLLPPLHRDRELQGVERHAGGYRPSLSSSKTPPVACRNWGRHPTGGGSAYVLAPLSNC